MTVSAIYTKYILLGIVSYTIYASDLSPLLNYSSFLAFVSSIAVITTLAVTDLIMHHGSLHRGVWVNETADLGSVPCFPKTYTMQDSMDRYAVQEKWLGKKGQELLCKKSVSVVGLGGPGSVVAGMLARAGVGSVALYDTGKVTADDVRTGIYRQADIGRARPAAMYELLRQANSSVCVSSHIQDFLDPLPQSSLIIDFAASPALERSFHRRKLPVIRAGTADSRIQIGASSGSSCDTVGSRLAAGLIIGQAIDILLGAAEKSIAADSRTLQISQQHI